MAAKKKKGILLASALLIVLFGVGSFFWWRKDKNDPLASGRQYLDAQQQKATEDLRRQLDSLWQKELTSQMDQGKLNIGDLFVNALFLGDSRAMGLAAYSFIDPQQVIADGGDTIEDIDRALPEIQKRKPENIYLAYGINDMGMNVGVEEGGYGQVLERQVRKILKANPQAHIYISSIIPASPFAVQRSPRWSKSAEFNEQIRQVCQRNGWTYIDNDSLAEGGNAPIYQEDGVHFQRTFYESWLSNLYNQGQGSQEKMG